MQHLFRLVGPNQSVELFGVKLVGVNADNGKKLLISIVFIVLVYALSRLTAFAISKFATDRQNVRVTFWARQGAHLAGAIFMVVGLASIWFDDPTRLTTAAGLVSAGLAFALQRVITAFAGYFVILRGNTFNVGDRIVMGGVRGDVVGLGFIQTTVMEMGQPPAEQQADPAMWVRGRQYTGRIVTITNDKVFDEPIFNYSREFPYIWEEMTIPVAFSSDRARAEQILLGSVEKHVVQIHEIGEEALRELERRYFVRRSELGPRVFWRITDNWLEMSVRFLTRDAGVREVKDAVSRDILAAFDAAGIGIASGTYDIVGLPKVHVVLDNDGSGPKRVEDGAARSDQPGFQR